MGYLVAAELAPNLLFSLHAGAWADQRARKRRIMIATDLGRALAIGSIPVAYAFDALTFPHMYVVAFLMGTLSVFFQVSYNPLFVALVPRERFVEGDSIMHGSRALSYVAGPSIGGLLVQVLTAPVTPSRRCLLLRRLGPLPAERRRRGARARGARQGPCRRRRPVGVRKRRSSGRRSARRRRSTSSTSSFFALFILYATTSLDVASWDARARARSGRRRQRRSARSSPAVLPAGSASGRRLRSAASSSPRHCCSCRSRRGRAGWSSRCLFLAEFGSGLGVMMLDISGGAIFSAVVPDRLRSRVSGAYMVVNYGVRPLGALAGGALGTGSASGRHCGSRRRARSRDFSGSCRRRSSGSASCRSPRMALVSN